MKLRQVTITLLGSFVVYLFVACSADTARQVANQVDAGQDVAIGDVLADAMRDALGVDGSPVSDALADTPPATSGTRLKARYTVTTSPDGASAKAFAGWHDATLGFDCNANTASDGSMRCLPSYGGASVVGYTDAACTQPFVVGYIGCGSGGVTVADTSAGLSCAASLGYPNYRYRTFKTSAVISAPGTWYNLGGTGACTKASGAYPSPAAGQEIRSATEIAPSDLAPMTVTTTIE